MELPLPLEIKVIIFGFFCVDDIAFVLKTDKNTSLIFCNYYPLKTLIAIIKSKQNNYVKCLKINFNQSIYNISTRLCCIYNNFELFLYFIENGAETTNNIRTYIESDNVDFMLYAEFKGIYFDFLDYLFCVEHGKNNIAKFYFNKFNYNGLSYDLLYLTNNMELDLFKYIFNDLVNYGIDFLKVCVKKYKIDIIKFCLDNNVEVTSNCIDNIIEYNRLDVLNLIIDKSIGIHYKNEKLLRWSSKMGYYEIVSKLLKKGAVPNAKESSALYNALKYGHVKIIKLLCEYDTILSHKILDELFNPDKYKYIKIFTDNNINIIITYNIARKIILNDNIQNIKKLEDVSFDLSNNDFIIFETACKDNYVTVVKYFIDNYAVNVKKGLLLCLTNNSIKVFHELIKLKNNFINLNIAIAYNNYYVVNFLLDKENITYEHLKFAIEKQNINIIQLLLSKLNSVDDQAINAALKTNNKKIITLITPYIKKLNISSLYNLESFDYLIRNCYEIET